MANINSSGNRIWNATIFCGIVALSIIFFNLYAHKKSVLYGDALGYYSYLPTFFIHHNVDAWEKLPADSTIPSNVIDYLHDIEYSFPRSPKGKVIIQYSYGVALLYSPFFLIAKMGDTATMPNGYTGIYEQAIRLGNLFYLVLGLWCCYLIFSKFCSRQIAAITCFLLFIGTNLFWFGVAQAGMAHIPLFFLVAWLSYTSLSLSKEYKYQKVLIIFFLMGLITLIRPSDFILCIIPIIFNWKFRKNIFSNTKLVSWIVAFLLFFLPSVPQFILWKQLTGSFFYYSYGNQSFHFLQPHIWSGLFSYQNGWLIYSPIFILSFLSVIIFWKYILLRRLALVIFPLYIYITYCWFNPEYINGFGSRPMLHIYPVCGIFIALFLQKVLTRKWAYFLTSFFLISAVCYNIMLSQRQITDQYWSENANSAFLKSTFFKNGLSYNDLICFDNGIVQPDTTGFISKETLIKTDTLQIEEKEEFPQYKVELPLKRWRNLKTKKWIKCSITSNAIWPVPDLYQNHLLVFKISQGSKTVLWKAIRVNNKMGINKHKAGLVLHNCITNYWDEVYFFINLPDGLHSDALASLTLWNIGKKPLIIGSMSVTVY